MDKNERVNYWLDIAEYDLETAMAMFSSKRYLYVGFMCHQVIEKMLKAYFCSVKEETPPYVHNLKRLAEENGLLNHFSETQLDFIDELLPMNIEARYPTYKEHLLRILTADKCKSILKQTEELCIWIKQQL